VRQFPFVDGDKYWNFWNSGTAFSLLPSQYAAIIRTARKNG
jgi:hypothetical protein